MSNCRVLLVPAWTVRDVLTFADCQAEDICVLVRGKRDRCTPGMRVLARDVSSRSFF